MLEDNKKRKYSKIPTPFSLKQLKRLFGVMDNTKMLMACSLAVVTGMRLNEVLTTKINDIEWELGRIKKQENTKGGKPAVFYLNKGFIDILRKWVSLLGETEYLFPSKQKQGIMSRQGFYSEFRKYLKKANLWIEDKNHKGKRKQHIFTFHTFRTTFCSFLINAGVPVFATKTLMRHSKITTTERHYTYLGDMTLKKEMDRVFGNNKVKEYREQAEEEINNLEEHKEKINKIFETETRPQREPLHELQISLVQGKITLEEFNNKSEAIMKVRNFLKDKNKVYIG
jgi:integrase